MVCEKGERTTFKEKTKMFDRMECSKEFSVKSGIAGFSGGKFFGKESKGLPGSKGFLLEDSSHVGIRGISGQGEGSRRIRVFEGYGRDKGGFCNLEGKGHFRGPSEAALAFGGRGQRG